MRHLIWFSVKIKCASFRSGCRLKEACSKGAWLAASLTYTSKKALGVCGGWVLFPVLFLECAKNAFSLWGHKIVNYNMWNKMLQVTHERSSTCHWSSFLHIVYMRKVEIAMLVCSNSKYIWFYVFFVSLMLTKQYMSVIVSVMPTFKSCYITFLIYKKWVMNYTLFSRYKKLEKKKKLSSISI